MKRVEAEQRIGAAFEKAGYRFAKPDGVQVWRSSPGLTTVQVITAAPWRPEPFAAEIVYDVTRHNRRRLVEDAEQWAATHSPRPPYQPDPHEPVLRLSSIQAEQIEEAMGAAVKALVNVSLDDEAALAAARRLAQVAALFDGDVIDGCDGCDIGRYSQAVVEHADLPPVAEVRNSWDDIVEASFCPFCVLADENEPPDFVDEVSDAEMARIIRDEQDQVEGDGRG
jgi:hypothetical protein